MPPAPTVPAPAKLVANQLDFPADAQTNDAIEINIRRAVPVSASAGRAIRPACVANSRANGSNDPAGAGVFASASGGHALGYGLIIAADSAN